MFHILKTILDLAMKVGRKAGGGIGSLTEDEAR